MVNKFNSKKKEVQVYIQTNSTCNQKCVFCNRPPNTDRSGMIKKEVIEKKIKKLSQNKDIKRIIFTGGEPTLYPDLTEVIHSAKQHGFMTEIQTNGTLLNDKKLKELKNSGLDIINFAFHSYKKDISNKLRGANFGFETIIRNIVLADKIGFTIHIIHVINSLNYKDLPEFVDYLKGLQLHPFWLNLSIVVPEGWAWENKWIIPKLSNLKPYLIKAMEKADKYNIKFDVSEIVPLCIVDKFEEHVVSTLFRVKHLEIIDDYVTGERKLDFKNPSPHYAAKAPQCKKCTFQDICGGFYPRYGELYGVKEFHPRTDDPTPVLRKLGLDKERISILRKRVEKYIKK